MNRSKILIGCFGLAMLLLVGACKPDYETKFDRHHLEVPHKSRRDIYFEREGGTETIEVKTDKLAFNQWQAKSDATWCTVEKLKEGKVKVTASDYDGYQTRKALVTINYGHQEYRINVQQLGYDASIKLPEEDGVLKLKEGTFAFVEANEVDFTASIETNLNIDYVLVPDTTSWVTYDANAGLATGSGGRKILKLKLEPNRSNSDRYCTITLQSSQNWDSTIQFVVLQSKQNYTLLTSYHGEEREEVSVKDIGQRFRIPFNRGITDGTYSIEVSEEAKEWLTIPAEQLHEGKLSSTKFELYAEAKTNLGDDPRRGSITLTSENNNKRFVLNFNQQEFQNIAPENVANVTTTAGAGYIDVSWEHAELLNYNKVEVTMTSTYEGLKPRTMVVEADKVLEQKSLRFNNTFAFAGEYTFSVKTYGPKGKPSASPQTAKGRSEAWSNPTEKMQVPLTEDLLSNNHKNLKTGTTDQRIGRLVDNDPNTDYATKDNSDDGKAHYIQVNLPKTLKGSFFFDYLAKSGGQGLGDIMLAKVFGQVSGSEEWEELPGELNYPMRDVASSRKKEYTTKDRITIPQGKNYASLRFVPKKRRNNVTLSERGVSADWFNLSELRLWEVPGEDWAKENLATIFPEETSDGATTTP